jgi:glucose-6-phosphate-specific signal transduction histidine kinase
MIVGPQTIGLMDKKVFINYEGVLQFSNALDLLNASINEFNKVADKMVPEKLLNDGFLNYLQEFGKSLEGSSKVKFIINSRITELETEEETEIILFRVMRSVLMVLLKNSQPLFIYVDLVKSERFLKIRIEDDGTNIFKQPLPIVSQTIDNIAVLLETVGGTLATDTMAITGNRIEIDVQL